MAAMRYCRFISKIMLDDEHVVMRRDTPQRGHAANFDTLIDETINKNR